MSALRDTLYGKFDIRKYGRQYTPDILMLQQEKLQTMFLPCDMKRGMRNHDMLANSDSFKDCEFLGQGYTNKKFVLHRKNLGDHSFPIPLPGIDSREVSLGMRGAHFSDVSARVRGELWDIPTELVVEVLDKYKRNGVEFQRQKLQIIYPYKTLVTQLNRDSNLEEYQFSGEQIYHYTAWMYVGLEKYWADYFDGGYTVGPCRLFGSKKRWMDQYYEFR